jgi:hypothetical protein
MTKCPSEHRNPHVDSTICGKCRKPFAAGHRVCIAYIVENSGINPETLQRGLWLFEEYELVHRDCTDPFLTKGI